MKKCPFCAEEIKDEAIRCRYCQADLIVEVPLSKAPNLPQQTNRAATKIVDYIQAIKINTIYLSIVVLFFPLFPMVFLDGGLSILGSEELFWSNIMQLLSAAVVVGMIHTVRKGEFVSRKPFALYTIFNLLNGLGSYLYFEWDSRMLGDLGKDIYAARLLFFSPVFLIMLFYILLEWEKISSKFVSPTVIMFTASLASSIALIFSENDIFRPTDFDGGWFFLLTRIEGDIPLAAIAAIIAYASLSKRVELTAGLRQ